MAGLRNHCEWKRDAVGRGNCGKDAGRSCCLSSKKHRKALSSASGRRISLIVDERRPPFEDDVVRYYGQYVAVVVAHTVEQARAAAESVKVSYSIQKPMVEEKLLGSPLRRTSRMKRASAETPPESCNQPRSKWMPSTQCRWRRIIRSNCTRL